MNKDWEYRDRCIRCGHDLIIGSNFMRSDLEGDIDPDDDAMITYATCPYCGAQYELTDVSENEKKDYPYWNEE